MAPFVYWKYFEQKSRLIYIFNELDFDCLLMRIRSLKFTQPERNYNVKLKSFRESLGCGQNYEHAQASNL
jgi:hypothetical protein